MAQGRTNTCVRIDRCSKRSYTFVFDPVHVCCPVKFSKQPISQALPLRFTSRHRGTQQVRHPNAPTLSHARVGVRAVGNSRGTRSSGGCIAGRAGRAPSSGAPTRQRKYCSSLPSFHGISTPFRSEGSTNCRTLRARCGQRATQCSKQGSVCWRIWREAAERRRRCTKITRKGSEALTKPSQRRRVPIERMQRRQCACRCIRARESTQWGCISMSCWASMRAAHQWQ